MSAHTTRKPSYLGHVSTHSPGKLLAASFRPFIMLPPVSPNDVDLTILDMAKAIDKNYSSTVEPLLAAISYKQEWDQTGSVTIDGLTYKKGVNDHSADILLNTLIWIAIENAKKGLYQHGNYGCEICGNPECGSDHS